MDKCRVTGLAVVAAAAVFADTVDPSHEVKWRADVTDGMYNDAANWTDGVVPADGADGHYGIIDFQSKDVTVRAPAGGLTENSGTIFLGCGAGTHTLTIDTRGSFWEKKAVKSINDWWYSPFSLNLTGSHVFNFEGGAKNVANNDPVWKFTDALFTWTSTQLTRQDFDLQSGTFSFSKPLYLGSNGGQVNFVIHPEASIQAPGALQQRGNAVTHTTFLGGRHWLNGIVLKDENAGRGTTWLHVTNDAFVASSGGLSLGNRSAINDAGNDGLATGCLDVSGTARMEVTNEVRVGSGKRDRYNLRNAGFLSLRDDASFYAHNEVFVGDAQASTGTVTMTERAVFDAWSNVRIGNLSNAVGRVEMSDDAVFHSRGVFRPGSGQNGAGDLVMRDRARLDVGLATGHWLSLGTGTGTARGRVDMADETVLTLGDWARIEMTLGGDARAEIVLSGHAQLVGGLDSYVTNKSEVVGNTSLELAGESLLSTPAVYGAKPGTCDPCMSLVGDGGTLRAAGNVSATAPFLSGCVGTLRAGGLKFDTHGFDLIIDQDFSAAADAPDAAFVKTGAGALTVRRASSHPRTRVERGALVFGAGVDRFGRVLDVAPAAQLVLADASAAIVADEVVFTDTLAIQLPEGYELDQAHPVLVLGTALTAAQLAKVVVANPAEGRAYAFTTSEDGKTVSVTVSAATAGVLTWTGANGNTWQDAGNWTPAGVPTHNDTATVASGAAIALDGLASVGTLDVTATAPVTVSGADALQVVGGVAVAPGGALTLAAPVRAAGGATVKKTGAGEATLSGANDATMTGNWSLEGGVTTFASAAALGVDTVDAGALALSNCTFRYTGEAATVTRPWALTGAFPAVFDIVGDLTFADFRIALKQGDNGIVKTGAGVLTLEVPAGTTTLSSWKESPRKSNVDPSGHFAPSHGEVASWNGLGQLSVLEGRLLIQGRGKAQTTVKQEHHGAIGGGNWAAAAKPELYLKDVTMIQGSGNGFHLQVDQQVRAGCPASSLVLDNADLTCNGLNLGYNKVNGNADEIHPSLAITNGTLNIGWNMSIPADVAGISPIVRVGPGGAIRRATSTVAGGVTFARKIDARFEDGGQLEVGAPQSLWLSSTANGELAFTRGGGMKVNRVVCKTDRDVAFAFDGGCAEFTLNGGISSADDPDKVCFRADAGGGELKVGAGVTHALAMPLRGEGAFTKTGAGTLILTNDLTYTVSDNQPVHTDKGTCTLKVANAGGVRVAEGTLFCVAGTTDASARFSGTGTLGGTFGESFTLAVDREAADGLTLAGAPRTVVADFGYTEEDPAPNGGSAVVAKVPDADLFGATAWKAQNLGPGKVATFVRNAETGVVTATFKSSGVVIYLR